MPFSKANRSGTISGIIFVAIFAAAATFISTLSYFSALGISPLVIGIVLGIFYANTLRNRLPEAWSPGIVFSAKKILRFAIVLYGFNISFQQIASVGLEGFTVSVLIVLSTMIVGIVAGTKLFKMDFQTSALTASGGAVCGAAAVLATEPVLKAPAYKSAVAVSMVVLFGTAAMFLYPAMYGWGILDMSDYEFGIYVGATIHEVAQVVAVGLGFGGEIANDAIIVKMTRVMLIAPMLLIMGFLINRFGSIESGKNSVVIPWFALYFIGVSALHSLHILPVSLVDVILQIDTFLLTMAMTALGMETVFSKFKGLGLAPFYTALTMFVWLLVGGYFITKGVVALL